MSDDPSASVDLPGLRVCRRYGSLVFLKPVCKTVLEDTLIGIDESVTFGDWQIELTDGRRDGAYHADATKLSFPLSVRARREGDRIFMGGMHKSVKKLMIDRKIPKEMRDNIPVLLDNNRVVAIAGIGFDRTYASDKENNIISIYFRRIEL
jgi:tRNA(Ile)-lysidine synthetase-like protein